MSMTKESDLSNSAAHYKGVFLLAQEQRESPLRLDA